MLGLRIFVRNQTLRRRPFLPLHNFCHLLKKCLLNFPVKILLCNSSALRIKVKHYTSANFCRNICNFFLCLLLLSHHCIGTYVGIRSWHKSMLGSHVRISCRDLMSGSDVHFSVGFPVFTVKYFSIFGNLYLSLPFSVRFPVFAAKHFSKLEFCIYQCFSGLDFLIQS